MNQSSDNQIIGIDIARRVFHILGTDKSGREIFRKKLNRKEMLPFFANLPKSVIGIEACGGSNFWGRELKKLGHEVRLIHPGFVRAYLKSNKNDYNDAAAIAEAITRRHMKFVPIKTLWQQELQFIHRTRQRLVESRTGLINQIRGFMHEYGYVISRTPKKLCQELDLILDHDDENISQMMKVSLKKSLDELRGLENEIAHYDGELRLIAGQEEDIKRIRDIPGIGPITATALVASMPDPKNFKNGRQFSAWLGLVA